MPLLSGIGFVGEITARQHGNNVWFRFPRVCLAPWCGSGWLRLLLFSGFTMVAATGWAQTDAGGSKTRKHVVSANPVTMLLGAWYNGEYERRISSVTTLGLSASRLSFGGEDTFVSANAALRYYPGGIPLKGFYLGPRVGLFRHSIYEYYEELYESYDTGEELGLFVAVGFELGYAWLLGTSEHLSISLGGGASRGFNGQVVPMLRFINIGWAY